LLCIIINVVYRMENRAIEKFINQVICGNALEILRQLPDNSIDLGITSPPYNKKEKHGGWLVDKVRYKGYRDFMPEVI